MINFLITNGMYLLANLEGKYGRTNFFGITKADATR